MVSVPKYQDFNGPMTIERVGRNINAVRYAQPSVGDAFFNFVDSALRAGKTLNQIRKDEEKLADESALIQSRQQVDQAAARLASLNPISPEGFSQAVTEEKEKWLTEIPDDKKDRYSLMFDEVTAGYHHTVVVNQLSQQRNQEMAVFLEEGSALQQEAMKAARRGDTEAAAVYTERFRHNQDRLFQNGFVSPERNFNMRKEFADNMIIQKYVGEAEPLFGRDDELAAYLQQLDKNNVLGIDQKEAAKKAILAENSTWKALQKVSAADVLKKADFAIAAYGNGIVPQGIDYSSLLDDLRRSGNPETAEKLQDAYAMREEVNNFAKMDLGEMRRELEIARRTAGQMQDLKRISALEKTFNAAQKEIAADPLGYAFSRQVVPAEEIDFNKPETVEKRLQSARMLQAKYNLDALPVLTKAERDNLSRQIASGDSRRNAALLGQLYDTLGDDAGEAVKMIAPKNPEFAHAAAIYRSDPEAALRIVEGVEIMQQQPEYTPRKEDDFNAAYYDLVGTQMFADATPEWQENLRNTVKAELASLNKSKAITDRELNHRLLKQAVKNVVGEIVTIENDGSGLLWDDSFKVPAPQGVSGQDFTDWFLGLDDAAFQGAVTAAGRIPTAADVRQLGTLHYAGNGRYYVRISGSSLYYPSGEPFVLNYSEEG